MADEDPFHAHDRLFRAGLSNPAAAAAFLIDRLPPEVAERIDWSTLKLEPGSFVDPDLRLSESDLLFSAKADGRDIGIYVLFEHQSTRDPRLLMRLLRYKVGIWHRWEQNPDNRPPYPHSSYMCSRDSVDNDALFHKINSIGSEPHRTAAMTLAQKLRQEGRMEGRQDGIQEGLKTGELKGRQEGSLAASRQSVLDALDLRFGRIPDGLRDSIEAVADSEKLRVLLRAAIVSDSIESFAGSL